MVSGFRANALQFLERRSEERGQKNALGDNSGEYDVPETRREYVSTWVACVKGRRRAVGHPTKNTLREHVIYLSGDRRPCDVTESSDFEETRRKNVKSMQRAHKDGRKCRLGANCKNLFSPLDKREKLWDIRDVRNGTRSFAWESLVRRPLLKVNSEGSSVICM